MNSLLSQFKKPNVGDDDQGKRQFKNILKNRFKLNNIVQQYDSSSEDENEEVDQEESDGSDNVIMSDEQANRD